DIGLPQYADAGGTILSALMIAATGKGAKNYKKINQKGIPTAAYEFADAVSNVTDKFDSESLLLPKRAQEQRIAKIGIIDTESFRKAVNISGLQILSYEPGYNRTNQEFNYSLVELNGKRARIRLSGNQAAIIVNPEPSSPEFISEVAKVWDQENIAYIEEQHKKTGSLTPNNEAERTMPNNIIGFTHYSGKIITYAQDFSTMSHEDEHNRQFAHAPTMSAVEAEARARTREEIYQLKANRIISSQSQSNNNIYESHVANVAEDSAYKDSTYLLGAALTPERRRLISEFMKARVDRSILETAGLKRDPDIFMFAVDCVMQGGPEVVKNFQKFGLKDKECIEAIARLCAKEYPCETTLNFKLFGLTDQKTRIEIASICLEGLRLIGLEHFQNFGLTDQEVIKKLILPFTEREGAFVTEHFKNFGLISQKDIKEIAFACTKHNAGILNDFQNFGLTDQGAIKDIALECARKEVVITTHYFQNLGLTNQGDIKEVALECARNGAGSTIIHFRNYGLKSRNDKMDVLLACARHDGAETARFFSGHLRKQEDIRKIAVACLEWFLQSPDDQLLKHFSNFKLESQPSVYEFKFNDDELELRYAVINRLLFHDMWQTLENFHLFKLKDEDFILEIAKDALILNTRLSEQQRKEHVIEFLEIFKNLGLKDPKKILEIAQLLVNFNPEETIKNFKKLGLENQEDVLEFALSQIPKRMGQDTAVLEHFRELGLTDQRCIKNFLIAIITNYSDFVRGYWEDFGLTNKQYIQDIIEKCPEQNREHLKRKINRMKN
ncbi:MAG: hypothetical protein KBC84_11015, partial [Proteobacteria bacterium]|nr:hypothetical protein [Pseudomonadota bacterium]